MPYVSQAEQYQLQLDRHELPPDFRVSTRWGYKDQLIGNLNRPSGDWHSIVEDLGSLAVESAESFRHSGWSKHRAHVANAMKHPLFPLARRGRFAMCGTQTFVAIDQDHPDRYILLGNYCKDRFCTPCANARSRFIADALEEHIAKQRVRFMTLTIRTNDSPLWVHIQHLYESFKRLRTSKLWAKCVKGGIAFLEIKYQEHTQRWHPHLHILLHGTYIGKHGLSQAWLKATGDSYIVDIRSVDDNRKASAYVVKYATKPLHSSFVNKPERLVEAMMALKSRRTIIPFGDWYRISLRPTCPKTNIRIIDSLDHILHWAREGSTAARYILSIIANGHSPDKPIFLPAGGPPVRAPPKQPQSPIAPDPHLPGLTEQHLVHA